MFPARDRNRFSREIQALVRAGAADKPAAQSGARAEADFGARMEAANALLEKSIEPLFESYADIVRKAGRTSDHKIFLGCMDGNFVRAAVADFWLDLTEIPGVSQYFLRLEFDGEVWRITSRPGLGPKLHRHESAEIVLDRTRHLAAHIEGALQQFIRLVF